MKKLLGSSKTSMSLTALGRATGKATGRVGLAPRQGSGGTRGGDPRVRRMHGRRPCSLGVVFDFLHDADFAQDGIALRGSLRLTLQPGKKRERDGHRGKACWSDQGSTLERPFFRSLMAAIPTDPLSAFAHTLNPAFFRFRCTIDSPSGWS